MQGSSSNQPVLRSKGQTPWDDARALLLLISRGLPHGRLWLLLWNGRKKPEKNYEKSKLNETKREGKCASSNKTCWEPDVLIPEGNKNRCRPRWQKLSKEWCIGRHTGAFNLRVWRGRMNKLPFGGRNLKLSTFFFSSWSGVCYDFLRESSRPDEISPGSLYTLFWTNKSAQHHRDTGDSWWVDIFQSIEDRKSRGNRDSGNSPAKADCASYCSILISPTFIAKGHIHGFKFP